ncbi:ferritin family protein, partial [Parvimonas sp. D9]|uniref:ferritin family protein n=1 Tax=Parvimonas sp. D9 TaxID=3110689 RepID=UPI002B485DE5
AFEAMAAEEQDHRRRLLQTYSEKFGEELPYITRQDVKGFLKRNPIWLLRDLRLDAIRKQAELMEFEAGQFYAKAADRTKDV